MGTCTGPSGPETRPASRRDFLRHAGGGFGMLALASLLAKDGLLAAGAPPTPAAGNPLAAKPTHFAAKAKSVIFLFMSGGPSHVDLFDPKPDLIRLAGQPIPESFGTFKTRRAVAKNKLLPPLRPFKKYGHCGMDVSDLLPNIAGCVDDLCLLRGCYGDSVTHPESVYLMNTGTILMGKPSLGSWVAYGLGSESENMPAFCVLPDPAGWVKGGAPAWGNGFLPAAYQGTILRGGESPILNLKTPAGVSDKQQAATVDLINRLNRANPASVSGDSELSARSAAYELAFRMQAHAPGVVDISTETNATRRMYGLDNQATAEFGLRCLFARRMVERGVRFVQLYCGDTNGWDAHNKIEANHGKLCAESDLPVAGLLKDLKSRGLLDSTLVIWGGEFGRTPMSESNDGRDHNPHGFCMWMAGGGVKGGQIIGATDAVGLRATEDRTHVHDIHATILHLMGMDHTRLTFRHNGRDERLTDVAGNVIAKALA
ncbi:DUF1501 domain-containing protein [Humisphaera borealis]|uniref:DUF1501 domain-containing protein n=1 Tax=Humisphaera borealis TaxID=2807512 RepID=A0A7M2WZ82_9BACT|nr:DUF1501 domain-containing protein [Humisphaera borealis]QOV90703.1 DUF1501 domain-containing protein [Humisphaera borealis]